MANRQALPLVFSSLFFVVFVVFCIFTTPRRYQWHEEYLMSISHYGLPSFSFSSSLNKHSNARSVGRLTHLAWIFSRSQRQHGWPERLRLGEAETEFESLSPGIIISFNSRRQCSVDSTHLIGCVSEYLGIFVTLYLPPTPKQLNSSLSIFPELALSTGQIFEPRFVNPL